MWKLVTVSLHCFSLIFSPSVFAETTIKCVKRTLSCWRLSSPGIYEDTTRSPHYALPTINVSLYYRPRTGGGSNPAVLVNVSRNVSTA